MSVPNLRLMLSLTLMVACAWEIAGMRRTRTMMGSSRKRKNRASFIRISNSFLRKFDGGMCWGWTGARWRQRRARGRPTLQFRDNHAISPMTAIGKGPGLPHTLFESPAKIQRKLPVVPRLFLLVAHLDE